MSSKLAARLVMTCATAVLVLAQVNPSLLPRVTPAIMLVLFVFLIVPGVAEDTTSTIHLFVVEIVQRGIKLLSTALFHDR